MQPVHLEKREGDSPHSFDEDIVKRAWQSSVDSGMAAVESGPVLHLMKNTGISDLLDLARWMTANLHKELTLAAQVFDIPITRLHTDRIVALPIASFGACTRRHGAKVTIEINYGTGSLMSFIAQIYAIIIYCNIDLESNVYIDRLKSELARTGAMLAVKYLESPFVLPTLRRFTNDKILFFEGTLTLAAQAFVALHEIAHEDLGHLNSDHFAPHHADLMIDDEVAADAQAVEPLAHKSEFGTLGVLLFLDMYALYELVQNGDVSPCTGSRLKAMKDRGGPFEGESGFLHYFDYRRLVSDVAQVDVGALLEKIMGVGKHIAEEANIPVAPESESAPDGASLGSYDISPKDRLNAMMKMDDTSRVVGAERLLARYTEAGHSWEGRAIFIKQNPEILGADVEQCVILRATEFMENCPPEAFFLDETVALFRRCREVGPDQTMPIIDVVIRAAGISNRSDRRAFLAQHGHIFSAAGRRRADWILKKLVTEGRFDMVSSVRAVCQEIEVSRKGTEDATPDARARSVPHEVRDLAMRLEQAVLTKDIGLQRQICERALELSSTQAGPQAWSLFFSAHLEGLPDIGG